MKKHIPTIVSVDWDYFLPFSDHRYDWGHHEENPVFYEIIWHARAMPWPDEVLKQHNVPQNSVEQDIRVDPKRVSQFWGKVLRPGSPQRVYIQDSHGKMIEFLREFKGEVDVINFDAHHDCGYCNEDPNEPSCANWVHVLKQAGKIRDYTLVYPTWRKKDFEYEHLPPQDVDRVIYGDWPDDPVKAPGVFLCRSSCWMPPWCDKEWLLLRDLLLYRGPVTGYQCEYVTKARPWKTPTLQTA